MNWAEAYLGWKAMRHMEGISCWDFVEHVMRKEFGIALPVYDGTSTAAQTIAAEINSSHWSPVEIPLPGDLAVLRLRGTTMHIGIMVSPVMMIHYRSSNVGAVIDNLNSPLWAGKVEGFYHHAPN